MMQVDWHNRAYIHNKIVRDMVERGVRLKSGQQQPLYLHNIIFN